jgi:hypothetical protein
MQFRQRTLEALANMICGNKDQQGNSHFEYRSSFYLSRFFEEAGLDYRHDGTTRHIWVSDTVKNILAGPQPAQNVPPEGFSRVIRLLMDRGDATDDEPGRPKALAILNTALSREGYEAFYAPDGQCYLRHIGTQTVANVAASPHRPFSSAEVKKRDALEAYLDKISEDELIEEILLPLFRQLGFHRVTAAGHKDKALEYGKDVWMRYTLPTQHFLYFGLQAKIGKLDAAGSSKNTNMAEIHNQALMMLGHEIFDPETSRRVLVDHAFIVAGGEITKAARNWLGGKLDASKRSQIEFMDRNDILNLFVVNNLPLPAGALPPAPDFSRDEMDDEIPF